MLRFMHVPPEVAERLKPWGFDEALLQSFSQRCSVTESNAVRGVLTPPQDGDVRPLPERGSADFTRLAQRGQQAIDAGRVGVVILAGGMATRFGGVVKAVVPVLDGRTFLQLKLADVRAAAPRAPVFIMSSFTTHDALVEHVKGEANVHVFPQFASLRLTPEGELFRDEHGEVSPYATGHGDLTFALARAGLLARFIDDGGELLLMSNVDNLGAGVEPAIIGAHLETGVALTAEVVRKAPGDKGGAPARLDGVPQIIEGFRFPAGFDQDSIAVFNTNTFVMNARELLRDFALPYYRVEKRAGPHPVIQFERLVGELSAFVPTRFLEVPREGAQSRFLPVKDPEELQRRIETIALALGRRAGRNFQ